MGDNRLKPLELTKDEQEISRGWATRRSTAQGQALRARIVLTCAEGRSNTAVAAQLRIRRPARARQNDACPLGETGLYRPIHPARQLS
ncbi:hypothetical protein [Streptomyces sp. BP-8]|uniref:Helix-turn-helix domain-containing protein n=1 Tax=Streptomyces sirii TaxID=3127701 RepID=A0ABZ2QUS9_9ACTN